LIFVSALAIPVMVSRQPIEIAVPRNVVLSIALFVLLLIMRIV
jgi:hypothetical protein